MKFQRIVSASIVWVFLTANIACVFPSSTFAAVKCLRDENGNCIQPQSNPTPAPTPEPTPASAPITPTASSDDTTETVCGKRGNSRYCEQVPKGTTPSEDTSSPGFTSPEDAIAGYNSDAENGEQTPVQKPSLFGESSSEKIASGEEVNAEYEANWDGATGFDAAGIGAAIGVGIGSLFDNWNGGGGSVRNSPARSKSLMLVDGGSNSANGDTWVRLKEDFLTTIQSYLVAAYGIIAVAVFIFIGFKLFTAKGNEADFKQAWIALVYACIGLAVAPLAYVFVKIIIWYTIS